MSVFAAVDTNVLISALISKKNDTGVVKVFEAVRNRKIIPLWHENIISEYCEVLSRKKFNLSESQIEDVINMIKNRGKYTLPVETEDLPADPDDVIFWQVAMAERQNNAYLITGNIKHYPKKDFVVMASEMIEILEDTSII